MISIYLNLTQICDMKEKQRKQYFIKILMKGLVVFDSVSYLKNK